MKTTDDLDSLLAGEDAIAPSAGFARSVMGAVREAAAEPPLRFPWGRLALGIVSCGVLAATGSMLLAQAGPAIFAVVLVDPLAGVAPQVGYAALGVFGSLALSRLPRLFVRS
jgi:hypothetical protein